MGKILIANAVQRKSGHLYYVDGQGNVCEAVMARGRKKKQDSPEEQTENKIVENNRPNKEWTNI